MTKGCFAVLSKFASGFFGPHINCYMKQINHSGLVRELFLFFSFSFFSVLGLFVNTEILLAQLLLRVFGYMCKRVSMALSLPTNCSNCFFLQQNRPNNVLVFSYYTKTSTGFQWNVFNERSFNSCLQLEVCLLNNSVPCPQLLFLHSYQGKRPFFSLQLDHEYLNVQFHSLISCCIVTCLEKKYLFNLLRSLIYILYLIYRFCLE